VSLLTPSAKIGFLKTKDSAHKKTRSLGCGFLKISIQTELTAD